MAARQRASRLHGIRYVALVFALAAGLLAAPSAGAATSIPGKVYFSMEGALVPVGRAVDSVIPATTSMQALLAGPTAAESSSVPSLNTAIPAGTTLNSVSITAGIATVDLSSEFVSGGGSASMTARLAQVVFTLTQFSTVDGVAFEIDGVPTTVFGGEGVIVDVPATRADFESELPAIFVDSPAYGSKIGRVFARISGVANVFEAVFHAGIYDGDGRELGHAIVMASAGTGEYGTFEVSIPYLPGEGLVGSLIVWSDSPKDGSQINVREYQILLGAGAHCRGLAATHVGTTGDDVIYGTRGDDVIVGLGGSDTLYGRGGDDVICGNGGRDKLFGNAGDDILYGGNGVDRIRGSRGYDVAYGGKQTDFCWAEKEFWC